MKEEEPTPTKQFICWKEHNCQWILNTKDCISVTKNQTVGEILYHHFLLTSTQNPAKVTTVNAGEILFGHYTCFDVDYKFGKNVSAALAPFPSEQQQDQHDQQDQQDQQDHQDQHEISKCEVNAYDCHNSVNHDSNPNNTTL